MIDMRQNNLSEFYSKNCFITGGLGLIGNGLAKVLNNMGAKVYVIDIKDKPSKFPNGIEYLKIDLRSNESIDKNLVPIVSQIEVHHLFNCVSFKPDDKNLLYDNFENYDFDIWNEILNVNTTSMAKICSLVGGKMIQQKFGTIVNFASIYGSSFGTDQRIYKDIPLENKFNTPAIYPVTKGGVVALTKHLATLWAQFNIRVNAISPGGVYDNQNEKFVEAYSQRVPMRRMATVDEVIFPAIFLSSASASYINGHELFVDGGLHAW
jgi:NAD(P)-dependent dehydrogenase (short-subunit alcohol dehydrogenase family)